MSETTPTTTVCKCSHARSSHNHDRLACKECAEVGKTCRQFIPGNRLGDVAPVRSAEDPLTFAANDVIPEITEKHRAFLESRGYIVDTIEDAKSFIAAMTPEDRASFFADFATKCKFDPTAGPGELTGGTGEIGRTHTAGRADQFPPFERAFDVTTSAAAADALSDASIPDSSTDITANDALASDAPASDTSFDGFDGEASGGGGASEDF